MEPSNRRIVAALASALGLSLLVIAFLLGRISAKPATVVVATPAAAPVAAPSALPEVVAPPSLGEVVTASSTAPASTLDSPTAFSPAPSFAELARQSAPMPALGTTPASAPVAGQRDRQNVVAYFAQLERIEDVGAGDPQAFASSMMQSLSSGDFSQFDDLLAKARTQKQRLQSMAPPSVCIEHHRMALALSSDSVTMLERLKAALMKGDSMALMGIASEGRTLETQANELKSLGEKIKRQAGV